MEFEFDDALIREIANGIITLSGLLLLFIFARYCWHHKNSIYKNASVKVALAIMLLMAGHSIRSGGSWIEFFMLRMLYRMDHWLNWSFTWFLAAMGFILLGKLMMIYLFAPINWRRPLLFIWVPFCLLAPLVVVLGSH